MGTIREILHEKRQTTENHIKELRKAGEQTVRYTAMLPDVPFLVLGLSSDIGWLLHLAAGIVYFCQNGFHHVSDVAALLSMAAVLFGVGYIIYLNKIHEKEIATRLQKNLGFGMTVYAGLAGAAVGIWQIAAYAGASPALVCVILGGLLNFAAGLPIYLSFKKGIFYGVK